MPKQAPTTDERLTAAATAMRADHGPGHPRHEMWQNMAMLLDRLAELAPYWHEPYAAAFVPTIAAGLHVASAYEAAPADTQPDRTVVTAVYELITADRGSQPWVTAQAIVELVQRRRPPSGAAEHPDHPHGSLIEQVHRVITTDQGVDGWVLAEEIVGTMYRRVQRAFEMADRG